MLANVPVVAQVVEDDGSQCVIAVPVNGAAVDGQAVELK